MSISYGDKSFLLIDDFGEFRRSVKAIVHQIGGVNVDQAANAEEAFALASKHFYDIILSDYNLGDGQDGQQFLEQLIHQKRLKATSIFIMVTAENTTAMVMGALEHQPDAYLTKPFNKAALQARLDKIVEKKLATRAVDLAMANEDFDTAMTLCDKELGGASKIAAYCLKIKAELLEKKGEREQAAQIYAGISKDRPIPWALLGLGRVLLAQGDAISARTHYEMVVKQLPMLLGARDGLVDALVALGEMKQAQQVLNDAVRLSPKAAQRQARLGEVALGNNDSSTATRAFRHAVSQGRHSIHKCAENYLQLAHCLTLSLGSGGLEDKRAAEEAQRALTEMEEDYKGDKVIALRSQLMQAQVLGKIKKEAEVAACTARAKKLAVDLPQTLTPVLAIEVATAFKALNETEIASKVLVQCAEMYGDDPQLIAKAAELNADISSLQQSEQAITSNSEGIGHFQAQRLDLAAQAFRKAIALSPRNISIVLNTAQALLELAKRRDYAAPLVQECNECLQRVHAMPPEDRRYARYQQLLSQLSEARTRVPHA